MNDKSPPYFNKKKKDTDLNTECLKAALEIIFTTSMDIFIKHTKRSALKTAWQNFRILSKV